MREHRFNRRTIAFARRAWVQQGSSAVWLSLLVGAGVGLLSVFGVSGSDPLAAVIPTQSSGLVTVRDASGAVLPFSSYLMTMAPGLLGGMVAIIATLTLPGVVADDVNGGGIEVLLASPIPRRSLFGSYLGAGLLLAVTSWLAGTTGFGVAVAAAALFGGVSLSLTLPYLVALIVLPGALGIWSATATLFGALLYPGSLESRAGMNGGPIRLLATAPVLFVVPLVALLTDWALITLTLMFVISVLASCVLMWITERGFRSTRVLAS